MKLQVSQDTLFIPRILSIAGTDPSGGAGMQADLKVFSAMKTYGMSVVTAVVAQNTQGVRAFQALDASFVADQIDAVFEDIHVDAVKIGMVANAQIARTVAERLAYHKARFIVFDPVMVAKSGDVLLKSDAIEIMRDVLVPMSTLITPNLLEASLLLGCEVKWSLDAMYQYGPQLLTLGCHAVLLKGGHLDVFSRTNEANYDYSSPDLYCDCEDLVMLEAPRFITTHDHGTGCTISAAIAALLPTKPLVDAVKQAKDYLNGALSTSSALQVGKGRGPLHHFYELWKNV
ncbi:bifunctional hydroxymethylpyrimidine kinase/phosphomethylpyrimidine kinase [Bartonella henselae]|uniref:bifunctional hydroxymethylpyrimidine kinase/phosphomethylpyrimidine kinase n=1 Tax=Bartonella henselae TaxID=38323 RepID=UPI0003DFA147|nr:bifunctional hydroxymethylpyrimidine kinase/phosphomethylpyrimidine kinase [Bartonella henselae]ETS09581.1 phosphomethylpyrimidine kinase [Bartonella henselae JK 42]ETS12609.1 phosphomethylpyrimidine kinase [Bartonella henselae JK 41]KEC58365.1 phosphomethylpyrimidine kinase [Bartonella henselae str. Zeus]KEC61248.1 phosphomethylpyrimidine kinase [Bartonella henselae JK 53]MDM9982848.1 bifunctional hydroxymethylpyrimidine kinase/phosphomethylpyrimidine kinase [Bartonella henselae]